MSPKKRTSLFLDPELLEGLKALKAEHGTPEAESVRRAIADYLRRQGVGVEKAERKRAVTRKRS